MLCQSLCFGIFLYFFCKRYLQDRLADLRQPPYLQLATSEM